MERLFADLPRCYWCAGFAIQYSVSGDFEGLANNLRKPSLYLVSRIFAQLLRYTAFVCTLRFLSHSETRSASVQYPANSSVLMSSSLTLDARSVLRISVTMPGGPAI